MRIATTIVIGLLAVLAGMGESAAQAPPPPRATGLFGSGIRNPQQFLTANGSLGVSFYDVSRRQALLVPAVTATGPSRGWGGTASGGVSYGLSFWGATTSGSLRALAFYSPKATQTLRVRWLGDGRTGLSRSWALTSRTHVGASTNFSYRPRYSSAFLPGGLGQLAGGNAIDTALLTDPQTVAIGGHFLAWNNGVSLSHQVSRRLTFGTNYNYQRDWNIGEAFGAFGDRTSHFAGARLTFQVARGLSVYGGYRYQQTHVEGTPGAYRYSLAEAGLNYGEGFTIDFTRNTRLTLNGGGSAYVDQNGRRRFRLIGNANLVHDMGRSWQAYVRYDRGIDSTDLLFQQPVLYDRAGAGLFGQASNRVSFNAALYVDRSAIGLLGADTRALRGVAVSGMQVAISRYLAGSVSYVYYRYQFGNQIAVPGFGTRYAGQSIRAYLNTWLPILNRPRRSNAAG